MTAVSRKPDGGVGLLADLEAGRLDHLLRDLVGEPRDARDLTAADGLSWVALSTATSTFSGLLLPPPCLPLAAAAAVVAAEEAEAAGEHAGGDHAPRRARRAR